MSIDRRRFLQLGAGLAGGAVASTVVPGGIRSALAATSTPSSISDIEHVVICMAENRSFDHYFGSLQGARGFADANALQLSSGRSVFYQPDPLSTDQYLLPWHSPVSTTSAECVNDLSHSLTAQHQYWDSGAMDGFVTAGYENNANSGPLSMSFLNRGDIPFHYALADAFTICDAYHCSVLGPTDPNRIMLMSATIDPDGTMGGPCVDNTQSNGQLLWTSYPERLQAAGIDWYVYQESDNYADNMLPYFAAFNDTTTDLYRRGNSVIATPAGSPPGPALAAKLKADVLAGNLPQVSWVISSAQDSEHPSYTPAYGARFMSSVIDALTADPAVWAKTVLFYNFDENDGFFDHVLPPFAPAGTAGEYLSTAAMASAHGATAGGMSGPVGPGFRVPMIIVSPFSRGGLVCHDTFDHTSTLRFLETRFGVEVPNLSTWRRSVTGDLTSAFNFAAGVDTSVPAELTDVASWQQAQVTGDAECSNNAAPAPPPAGSQVFPTQEPGSRPTPSGPVPPSNVPEFPWAPAAIAAGGALLVGRQLLSRGDGVAGDEATVTEA